MKTQKAKHPTIKTEWLTINPCLSTDTFKGKPIMSGSIPFGYLVGTVTGKHKGKPYEIKLVGGGGFSMTCNGRNCHLNMERLIKEAISNGFLEDTLEFSHVKK